MTIDTLVGAAPMQYTSVGTMSARSRALSEVVHQYESVIHSNRGYQMGEVSAGIQDLYSIARGKYDRTTMKGTKVKVTRKVDRATIAAQKVRTLGSVVSSAVANGSLSSQEAREVLQHAQDILRTTFSEKKDHGGKIGVHKSHYLNNTYTPDNPFAYLRSARGKITRASKKTHSFQYSEVPASLFALEEGVKTYYSSDNLLPKTLESSSSSSEAVSVPLSSSSSLDSPKWIPTAYFDHDLIKKQNEAGWTDRDFDTPPLRRRHRTFNLSRISTRGALDFFTPVCDIIDPGLGSRNKPHRKPVWSRVLTAVWLTALLGTFAVEANRYFTKQAHSQESVQKYESVQHPMASLESASSASDVTFHSHGMDHKF